MIDRITEQPFCQTRVISWLDCLAQNFNRRTKKKNLKNERKQNKELILDTNAELSRALLVLNDENLKTNKKVIAEPK
jgi:hypothetical protein